MASHDQDGRKPVSDWVHFKVDGDGSKVGIGFDKDGRLIRPDAVPESVVTYRSYERKSGKEKVVFRVPGGHLNYRALVESEFDAIAGIDTNDYTTADGRRLSISASLCSGPVLKSGSDDVWFDSTPAFIIESVNKGVNSELIGWHLFMTYTLPLLRLCADQKLAVVVDSEYAKQAAINSREEPYYKGAYLPENVTLFYATADTGNDLPNKLIKACDRQARELRQLVDSGVLRLPETLGGPSDDFAGFAYINNENSPYQMVIE